MSRIISSQEVLRRQWPVPSLAGQIAVQRGLIALDATALVATAIMEAVVLPANCVPISLEYNSDDLDGAAGLTLQGGFITGMPGDSTFANRVCGSEFLALGAFQAAVAQTRVALSAFYRSVPQAVDRALGFAVGVAPATPVVQTGTLTVNRGVWQPGTVYTANDFLILPNGVRMQCTTGGISGVYGANEREAPTQQGPNWNQVFAGTTADGTVTWTCRSPILAVTLMYAQSRDKV